VVEPSSPAQPLTLGVRQYLDVARAAQPASGPALRSWLVALLERNGPLAVNMAPHLDVARTTSELAAAIGAGDPGPPLSEAELVERACRHAAERGRQVASELDVAAVLLAMHGADVARPKDIGRLARPTAWQPRAAKPTPALDRFGRDLTRQAAAGDLSELVGRESELVRIVETLCRRHKRNPILLGEAGTGKTAIVEGFAQRVVRGEVPEALRGIRIVQLQPSSLVAGAGIVGEIESRLKAILEEASQDGIVLFIDEVHAIVGTGGMRGTGDLASLLKPALARGELSCIAATTDDEFRRFIEGDAALERRFTPITIGELGREATLAVLRTHRDELRGLRGVDVPDDVLRWLVDFAADGLPNRHFPDKAVDLLEQCVAHAVVEGDTAVGLADADGVARRLVGVPIDLGARLDALADALRTRALADDAAITALADRLAVTMRGLDRHRRRANAVVALAGPAAERAPEFAEAVAAALFGDADRVVTLDVGRMTEPHDVAMLVGAPPGYIGYSDRLPIHRVAARPWSVVLCDGVEHAHPDIRELLAEAFEDGAFVDGAGRRILLSEAIVLLVTRAAAASSSGRLGFGAPGGEGPAQPRPRREGRPTAPLTAIGSRLAALVDVVIAERPELAQADNAGRVLDDIVERFAQAGLTIEFAPDVAPWLVARAGPGGDLEIAADRDLLPLLARLVGAEAGTIVVECGPQGRPVPRPAAAGKSR
jgi:ATP-dependent Clp protease ATP-binding subunit ClpC